MNVRMVSASKSVVRQRGEGIVGAHAVGDGLACHTSTPSGQFRVKEGVFRKESLLIVQGKFHDGCFLLCCLTVSMLTMQRLS